ncbi:MAG: response regulator [Desulfamplus sp.]|nr:response regulator [Desulfamplus sp.]
MSNTFDLKSIIDISNKKSLEWGMAQKRIEDILTKFSKHGEYSDTFRIELEDELRRMWSDLETYKIELEMQNDELLRAFRDAEDVRKDYVELFNSSPVGYLILNSSAIILNANQRFADMIKSELAYIYQKPFQNFIAKEDVSDFLSRFKSYFKNPSDKFFELRLNDSRGNVIFVRLEGIRKSISGFAKRSPAGERSRSDGYEREPFGGYDATAKSQHSEEGESGDSELEILLISLSDITLLKEAEEEKETLKNLLLHSRKMEAIGTLAAGIAHDFNNILFPILGFSEMLKDELTQIQDIDILGQKDNLDGLTKGEDMVEMVQSIINNSLRAKDLVKQILAFSKNTSTAVSPIYLNIILTEVIISLRQNLPSNIKLVDIIDNTCSMVMADAEKMHQVIMNLITNALESMEHKGGGTLTITLREDNFKESCPEIGSSVNGRYVCLSVKDTGDGIAPDNLSRIFDPYFSTRPKFKGAGLGLSLVHGIIGSHDGEITVKSAPDEGSEFKIFMPRHVPSDEKLLHPVKKRLPRGSENIMVVDDQTYITRLLITMLKRLGYGVVAYNDPKAALESLKERPDVIDLLLTDMTMPEMSGDNVAKEAMQIKPDIPIIVLTGYSEKLSPQKAQEIGIKGYLMKPVSLADLADAVRGALDT